jgi:ferric-dicitrate binding protein FerR (iron transport regulator)
MGHRTELHRGLVADMTDETNNIDRNADDERILESLLKLGGPRAEIPRGVELRTYERVRREWKTSTQEPESSKIYKKVRRAWRRDARWDTFFRWALPAGGVAAAVLAFYVLMQPDVPSMVAVASVSKVVQGASSNARYTNGMTVFAGETLKTSEDEGLSLLLARSESLRVGENTELRVDGRDSFTLLRGRVYVDTGQFVYRNGGVKIETSFGVVTDVGTQFSVGLTSQQLEVAVREGRVDISNENEPLIVMVGERMSLQRNRQPVVSTIRANDEDWAWVADLAPEFDIENRSLFDFLRWAARETGRELVFESDELQMTAMREDIHGQISNLTPDEALEAVRQAVKMRYRIEADKIVIEQ